MLATSRKTLAWVELGIFAAVVLLVPAASFGQTVRPSILSAPSDSHQPQLSEYDKNRICLEEIYRQQVRENLTGSSSPYRKVLELLNAPITLWLLSSIVLSAVTGFYARHRNRRDKEKAQSENVRRLITDLSVRKIYAELSFSHWEGGLQEGVNSWSNILGAPGAFYEFKDRNLLSLAVELALLRPDDAIAKKLGEACKELIPTPANPQIAQSLLTRVANLIDEEERLTRRQN